MWCCIKRFLFSNSWKANEKPREVAKNWVILYPLHFPENSYLVRHAKRRIYHTHTYSIKYDVYDCPSESTRGCNQNGMRRKEKKISKMTTTLAISRYIYYYVNTFFVIPVTLLVHKYIVGGKYRYIIGKGIVYCVPTAVH